MSTSRHRFVWTPGQGTATAAEMPLLERLQPLLRDRASSAETVVREASRELVEGLARGDEPRDWEGAQELVHSGLTPLDEAHGWRGPVAGWLAALRELMARGRAGHYGFAGSPREALAEELGLWLGGEGAGEEAWSGEPLAAGRRLPDRRACAATLIGELVRGEVILVQGWSDTVALAIEEAQGRGLAPEVVLSEGSPDLSGRRMARRLIDAGVRVRMVYDAALADQVARADRVWFGTEAIGAGVLLARVGGRVLLTEARRLEVPSAVLATSDKLVPRGELSPPRWCADASWLLWERAPQGVRLESQAFESVPTDLPDLFATEHGRLSAAELSVRALRTT